MRGILNTPDGVVVTTELEVRDLRPDEVKVQIVAAGVCHSDVSVVNGTIVYPNPVVMGHEGAGIVVEAGPSVVGVEVGDHVVLSTLGNCGVCSNCERGHPTWCRRTFGNPTTPFTFEGAPAYQFANTSVFADYTVVKGSQAVPINKDVPFEAASLIGCGVLTGVGAVFNRAKVTHGQSAAVIGVGGIGLNVIQGLALSDALPIIAIDANARKEAVARQFGATHFIHAAPGVDTVAAVRDLTGGFGVDYAFECVGHPALIRQSTEMIDWGGNAVIIGVPQMGSEASWVVQDLYLDKSIMGCRYGSSRPHHDIPLMVDLYLAGRLKLDELITKTYAMEDINHTFEDMESGDLARGVLQFTGSPARA